MEGCFMFQWGRVAFQMWGFIFKWGRGVPHGRGIGFDGVFSISSPMLPPLPNMKKPNKGAQNWYPDAENSLYQPPACFLAQDFVYSIESLGEIIFQIRIFELGFILSHSIG